MKKCLIIITVFVLVLASAALVGCKKHDPQSSAKPAATASNGDTGKDHSGEDYAVKVTADPNATNHLEGDLRPNGQDTYVIKSEDSFEGAGFTCFIAGSSCRYTVDMDTDDGAVEWSIYLLDDKFTDPERFIPQAHEPALTESGYLTVEKGQYVYVCCSVNTFTAGAPHEGAAVTFTGAGLPKE